MEKTYEVHVKDHRKTHPHSPSYEICVVRSDNQHGKWSYGWPSVNKIILFGSGTGEARCDSSEEDFAFGERAAVLLCRALNEETQNAL